MERTSRFEIDLTGQTVLITGVSSGIGAGITRMFARANANLAGCALESEDHPAIWQLKKELSEEFGKSLFYVQADVTNAAQLESFVESSAAHYGGIDIVASNAGTNVFEGAELCTDEEWQFCMDLNLKSHWQLAKYCKPFLEKSTNAVIIVNASCHVFSTMPGSFPYNVAKTGLKALVQSLTIEWGPTIRVIGVAPGFIDTPLNVKWFEGFPDPAAKRKEVEDAFPLKRLGTPEEIGGWFVFLSSQYAAFAGGQIYLIDGGRSALMMDA